MSAKSSPRRVAAWAAAALLLVLAWWGVSALVVAADEAGVPPASALSPELRAVAQGDGDTECGSGGC
ncbi:MAG: hypothetical protein LBE25_05265 [Arthrobacter sp.]|jgi:hypothetical protein|nr:hypothetical protein [Arthrobacter sp.]